MEYLLLIYDNEADFAKMSEAEHGRDVPGVMDALPRASNNRGIIAPGSSCSRWRPRPRCACAMVSGR